MTENDVASAAFHNMQPCPRAELCRALDGMARTPAVLAVAIERNYTIVDAYGHEPAMHEALVNMAADRSTCADLLANALAIFPANATTASFATRIARVNLRAFAAFTPAHAAGAGAVRGGNMYTIVDLAQAREANALHAMTTAHAAMKRAWASPTFAAAGRSLTHTPLDYSRVAADMSWRTRQAVFNAIFAKVRFASGIVDGAPKKRVPLTAKHVTRRTLRLLIAHGTLQQLDRVDPAVLLRNDCEGLALALLVHAAVVGRSRCARRAMAAADGCASPRAKRALADVVALADVLPCHAAKCRGKQFAAFFRCTRWRLGVSHAERIVAYARAPMSRWGTLPLTHVRNHAIIRSMPPHVAEYVLTLAVCLRRRSAAHMLGMIVGHVAWRETLARAHRLCAEPLDHPLDYT